ncbi:U3 small nucleolar RNA-interacting protein 2 [Bagarius yarrelli]|uniref:U3 small nucleolar RNA-interacting protein 2 n=1 Tax=Bagarius yarrelli TaxID=175774 RepID=A0A556V9E5_BAGYA|nr:U3 small nucleolar RNA-interacting protein 2 [Bagarius yarrelli]
MSFFIKKKSASAAAGKSERSAVSKRKADNQGGKGRPKKVNKRLNEEISSESEAENDDLQVRKQRQTEEDEEIEETPQEKKLRLAKLYLEQLREEEEKKAEDEEFESDLIAGRLREDVLELKGKLQRLIADELVAPDPAEIRLLRGHKLSVTCLVITPDEKHIISASKDCSIIKWEVESGRKVQKITGGKKGTAEQHVGHTGHVLCMAISSDGKYLATGDVNKLIMIWDATTCKHLFKFTGHRDAISDAITGLDCPRTRALCDRRRPRPNGPSVEDCRGKHSWSSTDTSSHNASVQLWKCGLGFRGLEPLFSIPVNGFVNSLKFSNTGKFLVAGVGQEHSFFNLNTFTPVKHLVQSTSHMISEQRIVQTPQVITEEKIRYNVLNARVPLA